MAEILCSRPECQTTAGCQCWKLYSAAPLIDRDLNYDFVPAKQIGSNKLGRQCGHCGMKFDYGVSYGYHCTVIGCPMGVGG